ncbi:hypothetical protein PRZ48_005029 [Zasmidium cellare]|uniref:Major facilitator superfamily (MFS) profile domain-containing protein n=1 Tax=Zasmidium cellare TaxID=395010 RepID=A0ABR0ERA2_ZASCE|nr:hypothetical protein PRZ48_005029 [Zasmidium cellare]
MSTPKTPKMTEKELTAESAASSRPWTASTATTANNQEIDKTRLSAPQPATIARAKSEALRTGRPQQQYSIEQKSLASRRASYAGRGPIRSISPRNTSHSPSIASVSPTTTVCPTPKTTTPQRPPQPPTISSTRKQPQLSIRIPTSTDDLHADLHWQINAQNPRNWSKIKKWMHTLVPCALAGVFALGSSIVTPAHDPMMRKLHTSSIVVTLTLSLYVLGLAFGPYLSALGGEVFGRKSVYMICVPLYAIFMLASGLVKVLPGLLLCRFLAGVSSSPALHMGWTTLDDLWNLDDNVLPLTVYLASILLGSTLGPVLGAYLIWDDEWRWTQYVVLCALGACLLPVMFMQETSKKAILRRQRGQSARAPIDREASKMIFIKPLRMLLEPIVAIYGLYAAFNFGVLCAIYTGFPAVMAQAEHFDREHQGLSFLGMTIGVIIGLLLLALYDTFIHQPRVANYKASQATEEEQTLQTGRRTSRFSIIRPSHEHIRMSQVGAPETGRRRSSLLNTIRRLSSTGYKNLETTQIDPQRNVNLAVAAAKYINSIAANDGKHIIPERVLVLLNQNLEFAHLCIALESYNLKFDRVELARTLYDALQDHTASKHARSRSQNIKATEAALVSTSTYRTAGPTTHKTEKRKTFTPPSNTPPPEWRLHPSLPFTLLLPASLFLLGWSTRPSIPSILPIITLALFTLSMLMTFQATTLYVLECYGLSAISGVMMVVWVFGGG